MGAGHARARPIADQPIAGSLTVPQPRDENGFGNMRHLRLIPILAVVTAALLSTACSRGGTPLPVRSYSLGEKAPVGHIIYTVFETQWAPQLGDGPTPRVPEHRFFLVRMTAGNSGGDDVTVPNVTIEDDKGNSYPELRDGEGVPQWIGYLRRVNPAESAQGNLLFDAPPAHYKLRVTDENEENAAYIDIPLSFGAEVPSADVPAPPAKQQ